MINTKNEYVVLDINKLKISDKYNRKINKANQIAIENSIVINGFLAPVVITKKNKIVIDGQHRVVAAKQLKQKTVPCWVVDIDDTDEKKLFQCIAHLNAVKKNWTKQDYLEKTAKSKKGDYAIVWDYFKKTSVPRKMTAELHIQIFFGQVLPIKMVDNDLKISDYKFRDNLWQNCENMFNEFEDFKSRYAGVLIRIANKFESKLTINKAILATNLLFERFTVLFMVDDHKGLTSKEWTRKLQNPVEDILKKYADN